MLQKFLFVFCLVFWLTLFFISPSLVHDFSDGIQDIFISGTPAQVPREHLSQLIICKYFPFPQNRLRLEYETGCTETALDSGLVHESLLYIRQFAVRTRQSFQSRYIPAIRPDRKINTGIVTLTVNDDRTRPALTDFTAFLNGS